MDIYGIRFLGHNIPPILPVHFSSIFAFRIQNTLSRDLYFQSHSSFYGTAIHDPTFCISVLLDGKVLTNVLVDKDCLRSRERATLFFPFRPQDEGEYRLQIVMVEQHARAVSDGSNCLFGMALQIKREFPGFNLKQKVRHGLFTFLYSESPLQWKRLQLCFYRAILSYLHHKCPPAIIKEKILIQLKELNRELAFREKQVRELQVASLPCYLGIDTTSKCNLRCKLCFRNYVDIDYNSKPDMSADTLNQLIKELFPTAATLNLSTIGEPLISPHIENILKACSDYQVRLSLTTNGTLLKEDNFLRKLASVLQHIEISFDSAYPERFETLRSGASYEGILHNAAKLGAIRRSLPDPKFNLGFSMTLFRDNLKEIPDVLRVVSEVEGNFLKTDIGVIFSQRDLHLSVLTCPDLYNEVYEIAHEKARQTGINLLMRPPFSKTRETEAVRYGICDYLYLSACISSEGALNPCYFQPLPSLSVKNDFRAAWNSKIMQRLRLEHDTDRCHPLCRDCYLVREGSDSVENRRGQFLKGDALKWGVVVNFAAGGNADHYKVTGWGEAEGSFTWTKGWKASLSIPIHSPTTSFITLKARLTAFLSPGKVDKQTVRILINGKAVGVWIFVKPEFQEKTLFIPSKPFVQSNNMEIVFHTPDAVSPAQVGFNNDERVLGLAVQTIELSE